MLGVFALTSCTDEFLKETKRDAASSDFLDTPEGLYSMSQSLYGMLQDYYSRATWNYIETGTDEMTAGSDTQGEAWNSYDARINPDATAGLFDVYYQWIGRANVIISKADVLKDSALKNETLGTAYFTRAYCYMFLVIQFGDVPLLTEPVAGPEREFSRQSRDEVYKVIISDLENAYNMLSSNAKDATQNHYTKYAAAHYLAKAHLWRASEINDDWNSSYKATDLSECIKYADIVINAHPLVTDYNDLFNNFDKYDTAITETNTEIVVSMGNTGYDTAARITPGDYYQMYIPWYENFALMKRDVPGGRPYQRMKPTPRYCYYIYDLENDSRIWKSIRMTFAINNSKASASSTITLGDGSSVKVGDYFDSDEGKYLSTMYVINREDYGQKYYRDEIKTKYNETPAKPYSRVDYNTGKYIPALAALLVYDKPGGSDKPIGTCLVPKQDERLYVSINKFIDGASPAFANGSWRDVVNARSAEDYFFKAEALIRQNKINEGLAALQPLRERAQFKAGEARDAYVDGGKAYFDNVFRKDLAGLDANCSYYPHNSYYYSVGGWDKDQAYRDAINAKASSLPLVTSTSYPKEDQYVIDALGYTSDFDKAMCFLLNEKSREMYGELLRWMDLARTKTLEKRLYFNDTTYSKEMKDVAGQSQDLNGIVYNSTYGGSFNPAKHYVRPIPQTFLDNITKEGKPLTKEEKAAMQNPGY